MSGLSPDLVVRVRERLLDEFHFNAVGDAEQMARAALEASGHAELVEALRHWRVESQVWADILWVDGREVPGWIEKAQELTDSVLAKAARRCE